MGHPFFGVESRMGVVNIFGEEGWNGRPSIKLGWYTSLRVVHWVLDYLLLTLDLTLSLG